MSDGNGGEVQELEQGCPVNPLVRPGECVSIHAQLDAIRKTQRDHSKELKDIQKDFDTTYTILRTMADKLDIIAAQHGMRPAKRRKV